MILDIILEFLGLSANEAVSRTHDQIAKRNKFLGTLITIAFIAILIWFFIKSDIKIF